MVVQTIDDVHIEKFSKSFEEMLIKTYNYHGKGENMYVSALSAIAYDGLRGKFEREKTMHSGRADLVVQLEDKIIIIEAKVNQYPESTLRQLEKYNDALKHTNKKVFGLGFIINVNQNKNITTVEWIKKEFP